MFCLCDTIMRNNQYLCNMKNENLKIALQYAKECGFENASFVESSKLGDIFVATNNSNTEEADTGLPLYVIVKDKSARIASPQETLVFMSI